MQRKIHFLILGLAIASSSQGWSQAVATQDSAKILTYNATQFLHYASYLTVDEAVDSAIKKGDKEVSLVAAPQVRQADNSINVSRREAYLLSAAANADLVIVGEPQQRHSALTEGNVFIFSDYVVAVDRVYASHGVTVLPGQSLVVGRPGGIMQYRDKQITGSIPNFPLFHLNEPYVMFLKFVPETGSFLIFAEAAYNIQNEKVSTHTHRLGPNQEHARADFLDDVQQAVDSLNQGRSK